MNREAIYSALYARLQTVTAIKKFSRRLKGWSDVPAAEQPALFMVQADEQPDNNEGRPTIWTLNVDVYVYTNIGKDTTGTPSVQMNSLLDAIEAAVASDLPGFPQTLGGLVSHCWISGSIETDGGALDEQAVAVVPISMMVT